MRQLHCGRESSAVKTVHFIVNLIVTVSFLWNSLDHNYVLSHYKTELCKKPPRLCRQGYACPYYHNSKDRRRSPHKHKYRCFVIPSVAFIWLQTHLNRVVWLYVVSTERCRVLLWNRVRNGGIPVNVREPRVVSTVTPGQSSNFIQRSACFCRDFSQTLDQNIICWFAVL